MKPYQNRIVVKVGTSTLTNELGKSDLRCFDRLACVLSDIQNMGYEVILVSSGAIAVGRNKLKMKTQPTSMRHKQAAAAVGQCSIKLVIFSDIDGFYNCDPRLHPDAKLIEEIDKIDDEVYKLAGGAGSRRGTGGMRTKLQAAALATSQGIDTIITNGKNPAALYNIIEGVPVGTKFKAQ